MKRLSLALAFICALPQGLLLAEAQPAEAAENAFARSLRATFLSQFSTQKPKAQTLEVSCGWQKVGEFSIAQMSPIEQYTAAYDLAVPAATQAPDIIDMIFIDKMEIVRGGQREEDSLLSHITTAAGKSTLSTIFGKTQLAHLLAHPHIDHRTIIDRQKAMKLLVENPELLKNIKQQLQLISEAQDSFLLAWHQLDSASQEAIQQYVSVPLIASLNKKPAAVEAWRRLTQAFTALPAIIPVAFPYILVYQAISSHAPHLPCAEKFRLAHSHLTKEMGNFFANASPGMKAYSGFLAGLYLYSTAQTVNVALFAQKIANYLHAQANAIAQVRTAIHNLALLTQAHPHLARSIPSLAHIIDADNGRNHSAAFMKLWNLLDSNTFKHAPTAFSFQGRAIAAYHLMQEVKGEFAPALQAVGELDAFAAVATAFQHHANQPAHFSFATLVKGSTPYLKATNFWHPCLDPEQAITNDITISADTSMNIVITGPNTGGKTTILKALLANLLLAQVFGICTGELAFTPYARIHCHMNLTDDIASGTSLFKAEVNHAKKLIDSVKSLKDDEFAFIIMDEAFRSTAPEQGEQASYQFASQLAQNKQSNFLIATHYRKLIDLEADLDGVFRNYHVGITLHDNGSFTRTFKLERGASTVNIALELLKEEGVLW